MTILRGLFERRSSSLANPSSNLYEALVGMTDGDESWSGARVTPENALQVVAVYACVRLISETIGTLPVKLVENTGKSRKIRDDLPEFALLADEPNPEQDAGEYWRLIAAHTLLRGNAYAYKDYDGSGRLRALWPLRPDLVTPGRTPSGRLAYRVQFQDRTGPFGIGETVLFDTEIIHYKALGTDRGLGLAPVTLARQAVGTAKAAEEYGARFFANDARPGGVISVEKELTNASWNRLHKQWASLHQGNKQAHLMAVLEGGAKWQSVGISNEDAQFLETRKFQTAEIARLFGVPPFMIADVERSTSWGTGIEQQGIGFVVYTLRPWLVRYERTTKRALFSGTAISPRFVVDALVRGDLKTRYESYAIGKQNGWLSTNDILEMEDRDPIADGDEYLATPVGAAKPPTNPDVPV